MKLFISCAPHLIQDADQDQGQSAPNKQDLLQTNVADGGYIVLHVWIAIEILMPPAPDKDSGTQEDKNCDAECNAQRGKSSLFNYGNKRDCRITAHFDF